MYCKKHTKRFQEQSGLITIEKNSSSSPIYWIGRQFYNNHIWTGFKFRLAFFITTLTIFCLIRVVLTKGCWQIFYRLDVQGLQLSRERFSDQDYPSIFTATCPYSWARARAYTHARALSIHPKIIEMEVQNPDPHPCPHAKNGKQTRKSF